MLVVEAHAKINLSLEVVGKRSDGYHELVSIMQTLTLSDRLQLTDAPDISLSCSDPALANDANLVLRAARLMKERYSVEKGCRIQLEKRIPVAAGLAGGSSDAAATLAALARLWQLDLDCADLLPIAEVIGSDVPFLLYGGAALVEGRGECVTPLPCPTPAWYLLVKPPIAVDTGEIFRALAPSEWTNGQATRQLASQLHADTPARAGVNALQQTLFRLYPDAEACFTAVSTVVRDRPFVSGSGPTVVGVFPSPDEAQEAALALSAHGYWMNIAAPFRTGGWQAPCATGPPA